MKRALAILVSAGLAGLLLAWVPSGFSQVTVKPPVGPLKVTPKPVIDISLKPDLEMIRCAVTPATVVQDSIENISVSASFKNKGKSNAVVLTGTTIWFAVAPPDTRAGGVGGVNTSPAYNIVMGEEGRGGVNWPQLRSLPPGTYVLTFTVDPDNRIEESNETNNQMTCTLTVTPRVVDADLVISAMAFDPPQPMSTSAFNLRVTVRNQGSTPAVIPRGTKILSAGPYGVDISEYSDVTIAIGGRREYVIGPTPQGIQRGAWTWTVIVDPDNRVTERDEANNQSTIAVTVR